MANADLNKLFNSTMDHAVLAELADAHAHKNAVTVAKVADQIGLEINAMFNDCGNEVSFSYTTVTDEDTRYYGLSVSHQVTPKPRRG